VLIVKRILPKITAHIEQFRQSEVALRGAGLERRLTQSEELDLLLASRYGTKGGEKLHPAVDNLSTTFTKQTEEMHLRQLVEKALPFVLPEKEAKSKVLRVAIREIVACAVLYPAMEMLADPDFWNRAIDQVVWTFQPQILCSSFVHVIFYQSRREQQFINSRRPLLSQVQYLIVGRKLITKVRNVLDAQSARPQYRLSTPISAPSTETITIRTNVRQFESFLRSIDHYSSLLDARRLKNDIIGEIRRTRMLLGMYHDGNCSIFYGNS
jgi:sorting nexin-25